MTRDEIIAGFHKLYLENIAKETARRGKLRGIPMERLKEIHNESIADYVESFLQPPAIVRPRKSRIREALDVLSPRKGITACFAG